MTINKDTARENVAAFVRKAQTIRVGESLTKADIEDAPSKVAGMFTDAVLERLNDSLAYQPAVEYENSTVSKTFVCSERLAEVGRVEICPIRKNSPVGKQGIFHITWLSESGQVVMTRLIIIKTDGGFLFSSALIDPTEGIASFKSVAEKSGQASLEDIGFRARP